MNDELRGVAIVGNGGCLLENDKGFYDPQYCLPDDYVQRKQIVHFNDTKNTDKYQKEVYAKARELADKHGCNRILDIGCGSGYKLVHGFQDMDTTGLELEPALSFLKEQYPDRKWMQSDFAHPEIHDDYDIVICSDVVEHIENPDELMRFIMRLNWRYLVMSTPARDLLHKSRGGNILGPPRNRSHYREWTVDEFVKYAGQFFSVDESCISNRKQYCHTVVAVKKPSLPQLSRTK